jgi:hypothetical protein
VVNEDVLSADHPVSGGAHPLGVVVVLEEPDFEPFVEEAHLLEDIAARGCAEQRCYLDVEGDPLVFDGSPL